MRLLQALVTFEIYLRSGIGIDEDKDFNFVSKWEVDKKVDPLLKSIKKSDEIFLALDPDREELIVAFS